MPIYSIPGVEISIHALREEGDAINVTPKNMRGDFYPRPPRGGRLWLHHRSGSSTSNFYPRPPRGGRPPAGAAAATWGHISIHALREEGDLASWSFHSRYLCISIHALREEGDVPGQPAPTAGLSISIHALREEGDATGAVRSRAQPSHFYPRPPRGGRPTSRTNCPVDSLFLSTPSARRATGRSPTTHTPPRISIHALREEGDRYHDLPSASN